MDSKYIDITYPVSNKLPKWPGSIGYTVSWHMKMPEQTNNLSSINIDCHYGTHLDAPLHFVHNARQIQDLAFEKLIGEAYIIEIRGYKSITADILNKANIPLNCKKLLLKTDNQLYWESGLTDFQEEFCSIDASGAEWIVQRGIHLIGIDYLSIQRFHDSVATHQILLEAEVVIVETLNLEKACPGLYDLICLPLKLEGLEGAPVRAILKEKHHD